MSKMIEWEKIFLSLKHEKKSFNKLSIVTACNLKIFCKFKKWTRVILMLEKLSLYKNKQNNKNGNRI